MQRKSRQIGHVSGPVSKRKQVFAICERFRVRGFGCATLAKGARVPRALDWLIEQNAIWLDHGLGIEYRAPVAVLGGPVLNNETSV